MRIRWLCAKNWCSRMSDMFERCRMCSQLRFFFASFRSCCVHLNANSIVACELLRLWFWREYMQRKLQTFRVYFEWFRRVICITWKSRFSSPTTPDTAVNLLFISICLCTTKYCMFAIVFIGFFSKCLASSKRFIEIRAKCYFSTPVDAVLRCLDYVLFTYSMRSQLPSISMNAFSKIVQLWIVVGMCVCATHENNDDYTMIAIVNGKIQ